MGYKRDLESWTQEEYWFPCNGSMIKLHVVPMESVDLDTRNRIPVDITIWTSASLRKRRLFDTNIPSNSFMKFWLKTLKTDSCLPFFHTWTQCKKHCILFLFLRSKQSCKHSPPWHQRDLEYVAGNICSVKHKQRSGNQRLKCKTEFWFKKKFCVCQFVLQCCP